MSRETEVIDALESQPGIIRRLYIECQRLNCDGKLRLGEEPLEAHRLVQGRRLWICDKCGEVYVETPALSSLGMKDAADVGKKPPWKVEAAPVPTPAPAPLNQPRGRP